MRPKIKLLSLLCFFIFFILPLSLIITSAKREKPQANTSIPDTEITKINPDPPAMAPAPSDSMPKLIIGNPDAKVTLVEYGDFQCPFCGQFYRQTEPELIRAYVEPGKVNIEFRVETHIGQESVRAGEAAYCANDQKKFKAYHDQLFDNQKGENDGAFSDASLKTFAKNIGLDTAVFDNCLDSRKYLSAVNASNTEAKDKGVTSTPTIFIGDSKITGAQPFAIYKRLLDEQL